VASFFWSSCIAFYLFYAIVWHKDMMLSEVCLHSSLTRFPHSPLFSFSRPFFSHREAKARAQARSGTGRTCS
jgi:hypothetical protein